MRLDRTSYDVYFTHFSPTCGHMPLPRSVTVARSSAVQASSSRRQERRGPSSVAPRSRNPPTGRRRDSHISSSLFSHGPPLARQQSHSSTDPAGKDSATSSPVLTESVMLSFQSRSLLVLADESSDVTVCMKLFRDFNMLVGDRTVGEWRLSFVVCSMRQETVLLM